MSEFGQLVEHQIPHLRRYARALTRDREQADDLVQRSLLRALDKKHLWQPGTHLRHWLFAIVHNLYVTDLRRSTREQVGMLAFDNFRISGAKTEAQFSVGLFDLDRAIAELPQHQRRLVRLIGVMGLSYEEAASVLAIPVGTVRSRMSRARAALHNRLD